MGPDCFKNLKSTFQNRVHFLVKYWLKFQVYLCLGCLLSLSQFWLRSWDMALHTPGGNWYWMVWSFVFVVVLVLLFLRGTALVISLKIFALCRSLCRRITKANKIHLYLFVKWTFLCLECSPISTLQLK